MRLLSVSNRHALDAMFDSRFPSRHRVFAPVLGLRNGSATMIRGVLLALALVSGTPQLSWAACKVVGWTNGHNNHPIWNCSDWKLSD
jgi:hypothetical protein